MVDFEAPAQDAGANEESRKTAHDGIIDGLKAEFRFVKAWDLEGLGLLVCRRMRRSEMITFTKSTNDAHKNYDQTQNPSALTNVFETMVKTMCVWPKDTAERDTLLKAVFDEYPLFSTTAAMAINEMAKEGVTDLGKE